jgi:hypothetical protein
MARATSKYLLHVRLSELPLHVRFVLRRINVLHNNRTRKTQLNPQETKQIRRNAGADPRESSRS